MALFDPGMFDTGNYNGSMSGGLLGQLAQLLQQRGQPTEQQPMTSQTGPTFPGQANGMGSMGGVPFPVIGQPQQQDTALPPNATPAQYQKPQDAGPGAMDRISAGYQGFANAKGLLPAIGNLVGGLVTGQRSDAAGVMQANQAKMTQALYGALRQRGTSHEQAVAIAQAAATDPKMAETLLPQALGLKPPTTVESVIADRMYKGGPQAGPIGLDAIRQLKSAEAQGTKEGGVIGETQANAEMNLPSAVAQAKEALRLVGELRTHKGRDNGLFWHGKASAYLPDSAIPGNTDARDANGILQQIKGGAFLEAFKSLKGGGPITEVEGKKATEAITRMDRSQSKAEFDRALSDYEGIIKLGIDRANQQAGRPAPNGFKGNSEWQQVKPGVRIRQVN